MGRLPGGIAENRDWRGSGDVVGGLKHASGIGSDAEGGEIISGNILGMLGLGQVIADAYIHPVLARLESGELLEFGCVALDFAVEIVGEEIEVPVVIDKAAIDTAIVEIADPIEAGRIRHGQGTQQDGVNQGEDRGARADAECDREDHGGGKAGGLGKLTEGGSDVSHSSVYGRTEPSTESSDGCGSVQVRSW